MARAYTASGVTENDVVQNDRPNNGLDTLDVWVEASPQLSERGPEAVKQVEARVGHDLQATLGLSANVVVRPPNSMPRNDGKAQRAIDQRALTYGR